MIDEFGLSAYLRINPTHGVVEIGRVHLSKLLKRTSAATEAGYLMAKYIFEELGYRRLESKCNSLNKPSWEASLRFGFKFEGVSRQSFVFKGLNRDTAWYSIIDKEWPLINEKFEKWLSVDNFDETGKQRVSLREI
jgi:RimJ/RimL family protein N-acetyltransferase